MGDRSEIDAFQVKDSGTRTEFEGGMVRDTAEGKLDWSNLRFGPMPRRIVTHLTKGRDKYPDPEPGIPNWTLGRGIKVWLHARESYGRHNDAYLAGYMDEDHASALYFNVNVMEYVRQFFTADEELQAQRIEQLQREVILREAQVEDRKRRYLIRPGGLQKGEKQEDASLETDRCRPTTPVPAETPVDTGRRISGRVLLGLADEDDGTGLDQHGDAT